MFFETTASILQFGQDTASGRCSLMMIARELGLLSSWLEWVPLSQPVSWDQVHWSRLFPFGVPGTLFQQQQEDQSPGDD